jgi:hypothetical protein
MRKSNRVDNRALATARITPIRGSNGLPTDEPGTRRTIGYRFRGSDYTLE